jgi:hypothetical protein
MRNAARFGLLTGLVMAAGSVLAMAQEAQRPSSMLDTAGEKVQQSPLRFSGEVRGAYTDNRDSAPVKESNFDTFLIPRVELGVDGQTYLVDAYYAPQLRYRSNPADNQKDSDLFHDLGVKLDLKPDPTLTFRVREKFNYSDDPAVDMNGVNVRENVSYYLNMIELGMKKRFAVYSEGDLFVRSMIKRYEEDNVAYDSDRDQLDVGGYLWRQVQPALGVRGKAVYSMYTYGSTDTSFADRDFNMLSGSVELLKRLTPAFIGNLAVGAQMAEYSSDAIDSQFSPYAQIGVAGEARPDLRVNASLTHGLRESYAAPFASQIYDQLSGRVELDTSETVTLAAFGTYRVSQYDTDVDPTGVAVDGDETTVQVGADMTVRMGQVALKVGHTYEDVDSDVFLSFKKNTTSASMLVQF